MRCTGSYKDEEWAYPVVMDREIRINISAGPEARPYMDGMSYHLLIWSLDAYVSRAGQGD